MVFFASILCMFFMNPSWVNFHYVKPDLLIKLFGIELKIILSVVRKPKSVTQVKNYEGGDDPPTVF